MTASALALRGLPAGSTGTLPAGSTGTLPAGSTGTLPPRPADQLTWSGWTTALSGRGLTVLAAHRVPVQLWLGDGDRVLHLLARGTRVTLRRYDRTDLVGLMLRSECDCAEHRTAGARLRITLAPGAQPLAERVLDGADRYGWTGVEAGLAPLSLLAAALEELLADLPTDAAV